MRRITNERYIRSSSDFDNMTYQEFRDKYRDILKKYPDIADGFGRDYRITLTTENYEKSGGRWTLVNEKTQDVTFEQYLNSVYASPFFKGLGGKEYISKSYTIIGLIPVEIRSTSPDGRKKTVRKYKFGK